MSLTVTVKDELALVVTENAAQRRAEVSAMLRFAGDCTSSPGASSSRPSSTTAGPYAACTSTSRSSTGWSPRSWWCRADPCTGDPATCCA